MPENVNYKIDLYYGDIGFTSDYANVLQFEDAVARDRYFDIITEKDTVNNTDFNNIQLSGNTVKIAFTDSVELTRLEKYNYIRILTRLYGTSSYSDKYEYGFIVDYSIISSSSNVTVVEFTFETDLWQNYQFDFELKECNVERSHMDRWSLTETNPIYTRPSNDLLDAYMLINKEVELYDEEEYAGDFGLETNKIAWCIFTYTTADSDDVNAELRVGFFPIILSDTVINQMWYEVHEEGESSVVGYRFPTLGDILSGNLTKCFEIAPSALFNVGILFHTGIKFDSTYVSPSNIKNELQGDYSHLTNDNTRKATFYITPTRVGNRYDLPWKEDEVHNVNGSKPVKPIDDADYSVNYEPMMFKSPVMERYITNSDGSQSFKIPDIKMMDVSNIYFKTMISPSESYNIISLNSLDDESLSANALISAIGQINSEQCDIINSYWQEYCVTQRDADRKMMWTKIMTGGLADAGSTSISAGIGYRSNAERSFMYNTLGTGTYQDRAMAAMFDKYAKQAAAMSVVGGIAQYGANAYGTYMGQETKESAIKNKPAALTKTGNWFGKISLGIYNTEYVELKCDAESYKQYANIFKKFGYFIGGVIKPDIKSRKYFNYIKTNGAILTGSLNQSILAKLCRIFDNGVTIWHMDYASGHLYEYDKENIERTLIGE